MVLLDIKDGEVKGWIEGNDVYEIRHKFMALYDYPYPERRDKCVSALYRLDFPAFGIYTIAGDYILLVS